MIFAERSAQIWPGLGLQHVGERVLGHITGGESAISRVYNTYRYEAVRQALERWADEVERVVSGEPSKVVQLRA
jgi:hypothetical protein